MEMWKRGYCAIGLENPQIDGNIANVLRLASNYKVNSVFYQNNKKYKECKIDTTKYHRHNPLIKVDDLLNVELHKTKIISIELDDRATSIQEFIHPEQAYYIFGTESSSVSERLLEKSDDIVYVPTHYCMNLAMCVSVILYDRWLQYHPKKLKGGE